MVVAEAEAGVEASVLLLLLLLLPVIVAVALALLVLFIYGLVKSIFRAAAFVADHTCVVSALVPTPIPIVVAVR